MPRDDWDHSVAAPTTPVPTLDWNQDILEPWHPTWKPADADALAMPHHAVKSFVKPIPAQPPCYSLGRGQILKEKTKNLLGMGPMAASQYTGDGRMKKKESTWKPGLPTKEEIAERR